MLPVERIIGEEGLRASGGELVLAMRLPWYRSLPFSVVEVDSVVIGGQSVDLSQAMIEWEGQRWPLAENGEKVDTFWFVRDSAFLVLPGQAPPTGSEQEVARPVHPAHPTSPA